MQTMSQNDSIPEHGAAAQTPEPHYQAGDLIVTIACGSGAWSESYNFNVARAQDLRRAMERGRDNSRVWLSLFDSEDVDSYTSQHRTIEQIFGCWAIDFSRFIEEEQDRMADAAEEAAQQ